MPETRDARSPRDKEADRIASKLVRKLRAASDEQQFASPNLVRMVQADISAFIVRLLPDDDPIAAAVDNLCGSNHDPRFREFARKCVLCGMGTVRATVESVCSSAELS